MVQIQVKPRQTIPLGHRGENEARQVIFELADYISTYGPGTARLLHQRDGDPAPYIVPAVQDGDTLTWTVTDEDTAAPGTGSAELQWMVNNVLAKSDIWNTRTKAALDDGATAPPTGAEGWYQQLIAYIDSLRGEGVSEEQIAAAVEAYLLEHPVDVPVTSVNGKTGAVQLTAEDVGALAQDDLQAGVDAALAKAKASGEFDGQAGEDGGYYTPSVDAGGNLLWSASNADMPAVAGANIKGPPGTTGKSAYQYAQDGGYTGTEAEFAAKLAEEIPTTLPNPNALTFTGAVEGSYDGSAPLSLEIPSGGGNRELTLLADIAFEGNTASVFEYTGLNDVSEIYLVGGEIKSESDNSVSNFSLMINDISVASSCVLDIQKASGTDKWNKYHIMRYNGAFWESLRSPNHAGASPILSPNPALYPNTVVLNVGKAKKIKLFVPNPAYKPVSGWIKIWVR